MPGPQKVLYIGDSFAAAVGQHHAGAIVAAVDGTTAQNWAGRTARVVAQAAPDTVVVSAGLNDGSPEQLPQNMKQIRQGIGDIPTIWLTPPKLREDWLEALGDAIRQAVAATAEPGDRIVDIATLDPVMDWDGVHLVYGARGYGLVAAAVRATILRPKVE